MAKAKKATKAPAPVAQLVTPRIIVEANESTPLYYVNYMEVANTLNDFTIFCARLSPKLSEDKMKEINTLNTVHIDADVQVVIPISLVPGLIKALTIQKELFEKLSGLQIQEPGVTT